MVKYRVDLSEPAEDDLRDIVRYRNTQDSFMIHRGHKILQMCFYSSKYNDSQ